MFYVYSIFATASSVGTWTVVDAANGETVSYALAGTQ